MSFYVSAVYSGMIRNLGLEIEAADGTAGAGALFANVFVKGAFSTLDFHWIAPVLLLMFAFVLDYLWDHSAGRNRIAAMVGVALTVLVLDALIAFKIEAQGQYLKTLMGLEDPTHRWWMSTDFWIVLVMGFVATLAWGMVAYAFRAELAKTDARRVVALEIGHRQSLIGKVQQVIFDLKAQLNDLAGQLAQLHLSIRQLREQQRTLKVSLSELEKSVTDFYDGWLGYLNSRGNCQTVKQECSAVLAAFSAAHFRQPESLPTSIGEATGAPDPSE